LRDDDAMELVANALVYVGGYVFLVFMAVCLATGAFGVRARARCDDVDSIRWMKTRETERYTTRASAARATPRATPRAMPTIAASRRARDARWRGRGRGD